MSDPSPQPPATAGSIPAGTLVSLIGSLADFLSLREGQTKIDVSEFVAWLRKHRHTDEVRRIESDPVMLLAIRNTLDVGHGELVTRLEAIDEALLRLCVPPGAFAAIAHAARPDLALKVLGA